MSIGKSGRIVVEVDPSLKRELYSVLSLKGVSLKTWFTREAKALVSERDGGEERDIADKNVRGAGSR